MKKMILHHSKSIWVEKSLMMSSRDERNMEPQRRSKVDC